MKAVVKIFSVAVLLPLVGASEVPGTWTKQIVTSENHKYLCHIVPRGGQTDPSGTAAPKAYATFYYFEEDASPGFYRPLWCRELPNSVAPLRTRISSDGRYVVMIGDYDAPASGRIVIYSGTAETSQASGQLLVRTTLREILTPAELDRIPPYAAERFSSAPHRIDIATNALVLQIFSGGSPSSPQYNEVRVDLRTGKRIQ